MIRTLNPAESHITVQVSPQLGHNRVLTSAFIDSGAAGNFIDLAFADRWGIKIEALSKPNAIDGQPLATSPVFHCTVPLHMTKRDHME